MWKKIAEYLSADPLRLLTVIGGSGGLVFWYDRYRNRTRLRIKITDIGLIQRIGGNKVCMKFEIENLGTLPNSIIPSVYLSGITPECVPKSTKKRHIFEYKISNIDRNMPPNTPIIFEAYANWDDNMRFIWFIRVKIMATRGRGKTIFIRSFSNDRLSWPQYMYERLKYALNKKTNFDDS